jgi:hypothetical protein
MTSSTLWMQQLLLLPLTSFEFSPARSPFGSSILQCITADSIPLLSVTTVIIGSVVEMMVILVLAKYFARLTHCDLTEWIFFSVVCWREDEYVGCRLVVGVVTIIVVGCSLFVIGASSSVRRQSRPGAEACFITVTGTSRRTPLAETMETVWIECDGGAGVGRHALLLLLIVVGVSPPGGSRRGVSRDLIFWLLQVEEDLKRLKETKRDLKRQKET